MERKRRLSTNPAISCRGGVWLALFYLVVFAAMFLFYTEIHPLYIFDLDDWLYLSYGRHAFPVFGQWNLTKVLPETLFPLASYFGTYVLYPITGDYIQSLCSVYAFVVTCFILLYLMMAGRVLKQVFGSNGGSLVMILAAFFLAHFTPFMVKEFGNKHLFNSMNVNCFFNYLIPALFNFTLCFYFMVPSDEDWADTEHLFRKGILIFAVYLAINSNLWSSVILMVFFGVSLLFSLAEGILENKRNGRKLISVPFLFGFIRKHFPKFAAIFCWLFSMVFEVKARVGTGVGSFVLGVVLTQFADSIASMNRQFWSVVLLINALAVLVAFMVRKPEGKKFLYWWIFMLSCAVISAVYQVLLGAVLSGAVAGSNYMNRADVMVCWLLWLMLMTAVSLAYLCQVQPRVQWFMPLLVFVLLVEVVLSPTTFVDNYAASETPSQVKAINTDLIHQVEEAEAAGKTAVDVHLPEAVSWGWPLDEKTSPGRISWTLFSHGITEKEIQITIVPDPAKDAEFNLK